MEKLSTNKLKSLMSTWLVELDKSDLAHYAEPYLPYIEGETREAQKLRRNSQELLDEHAAEFGCRKGVNRDELLDHIYKLWCDGSMWKRSEKNLLKDEWENWLCKTDYSDPECEKIREAWIASGRNHATFPEPPKKAVTEFNIDVIGGQDDALLAKYSGPANEALARKCVYRCFLHANDNISNNYRLEVITTPEDDAVIGWCVTVD